MRSGAIIFFAFLLGLLTWSATVNLNLAQAGNKTQANKRLGHKVITVSAKSNRRLKTITLSAPALGSLQQQITCLEAVADKGLQTLADRESAEQFIFAFFLLGSFYGQAIYLGAEDRPAKIRAAEKSLLGGQKRLAQRAVSRRGHRMAAGLAAYARQLKITRAAARDGISIDLCALQTQLDNNNGYASPEILFTNLGQWSDQWGAAMPPGALQRYNQSSRRQDKIARRAERILDRLVPRRAGKFQSPINMIVIGIDRQLRGSERSLAERLLIDKLSSRDNARVLEPILPALTPGQLPDLPGKSALR